MPPYILSHPDGCRVRVHVQPRAKSTGIAGIHADRLKVRVSAPPAEGAANAACIKLLASALGLAPSAVRVERGLISRDKVLVAVGVEPCTAAARLRDHC